MCANWLFFIAILKHVFAYCTTDNFLNNSLFSTKMFNGNRLINIVHCNMCMYAMQKANYVPQKMFSKISFHRLRYLDISITIILVKLY